ncbi:MAG TPA: hypothetical protein VK476_03620 [Flavobacterium sp.]|nr:hypothetical protein [Flavobacterium sp.]
MSNLSNLSVAQLKRAVQIKEQIEKLQRELLSSLGSSSPSQKPSSGGGMSEATKAKLRAAAKARWAQVKAGKQPAAKSTGRKPMSAAARARLSALMKAKWAAKNKGSKSASAPAKKAVPKKSTMSAAAKARVSALAKARWAKIKSASKGGKS